MLGTLLSIIRVLQAINLWKNSKTRFDFCLGAIQKDYSSLFARNACGDRRDLDILKIPRDLGVSITWFQISVKKDEKEGRLTRESQFLDTKFFYHGVRNHRCRQMVEESFVGNIEAHNAFVNVKGVVRNL